MLNNLRLENSFTVSVLCVNEGVASIFVFQDNINILNIKKIIVLDIGSELGPRLSRQRSIDALTIGAWSVGTAAGASAARM